MLTTNAFDCIQEQGALGYHVDQATLEIKEQQPNMDAKHIHAASRDERPLLRLQTHYARTVKATVASHDAVTVASHGALAGKLQPSTPGGLPPKHPKMRRRTETPVRTSLSLRGCPKAHSIFLGFLAMYNHSCIRQQLEPYGFLL